MKKFVVLVLAVGLLPAVTFGAYTTDEIKAQLTVNQTASWSSLVWKLSTAGNTNLLPWAGTLAVTGTDDMRKAEDTIQQYGAVVNSDAGCNLGDGSIIGYVGTNPRYNSTLKLNVKTGTFNLAGQTMWTDKLQNGTQARTAYNTDYPGVYAKSVFNIGENGALRVTGTQVVTAGGNMQIGYAANSDSYVKLTDNGVLSGVVRDGLGNVIGGSNLDLARNQTGHLVDVELNGSVLRWRSTR